MRCGSRARRSAFALRVAPPLRCYSLAFAAGAGGSARPQTNLPSVQTPQTIGRTTRGHARDSLSLAISVNAFFLPFFIVLFPSRMLRDSQRRRGRREQGDKGKQRIVEAPGHRYAAGTLLDWLVTLHSVYASIYLAPPPPPFSTYLLLPSPLSTPRTCRGRRIPRIHDFLTISSAGLLPFSPSAFAYPAFSFPPFFSFSFFHPARHAGSTSTFPVPIFFSFSLFFFFFLSLPGLGFSASRHRTVCDPSTDPRRAALRSVPALGGERGRGGTYNTYIFTCARAHAARTTTFYEGDNT
ncbi:hypothetical protein GGS23DRAFT_267924 [Durotheca rogersii]|uniref:uncharacterized protein n=1 Tax=Durotheca rogersii TaxID=419775 RepID=UPI0022212740|nr:uncharacterized protein GGS23DRAFT_267924 [Durotheca rogersii]KAI5859732.1 hypothetical protein GGS23DRAFT_267924 [Durotheca rogersii]